VDLVGNLACQQWKSFFDKHGMITNGQYYWDILPTVSKMLAVIKHCAAEFFFGKQRIIALCMQHSSTAEAKKFPFHCF